MPFANAGYSPGQTQRRGAGWWEGNRAAAYRGSLAHFLKSVHDNRVADEGFVARKLRIVPNPKFARTDSLRRALLRRRLNAALTPVDNDSLARWRKVPPAFAMLYPEPRPIDSLRRVSAEKAHVFLRYTDRLQVTYLPEPADPLYGPQVSQLLLMLPEIEIQPNGQLANPLAVFTEGYWGFEKMGEFLPVNYLPPAPVPGSTPTHP